jgi:hypothetical protein
LEAPEKSFMLSNRAVLRRGEAGKAYMGCRLSLSSTMLAFTSMVGGSSLASALRAVPLTAGNVAGARLIGRGVRGCPGPWTPE